MLQHLGNSISRKVKRYKNNIRQHKVGLRKKPALLLAVIFLSGFLSSCGRLDMVGYEPRDSEKIAEKSTIPGTALPVGDEILEPDKTPNPTPIPEQSSTPAPSNTPNPTESSNPSEIDEESETAAPYEPEETTPAPTPDLSQPSTPSPPTESEPSQDSQSQASESIVNPYVPYTYDQMIEDSKKIKEAYTDIITLDLIGESVEGRELTLIKLGKGEKKIILCGSHHAREYISSSYLMKMVEEYSKAYYKGKGKTYGNYNVNEILDQISLYIVPMVNPDGVNLVINGLSSVSNQEEVAAMAMVKKTYSEWKANINGVDLNRQYPAQWEKKYDEVCKPASESFKGEAFATEPEVKAMMELSRNNEFIIAASFHTKGNVIYWADRGTVNLIPGVKEMAKRLSGLTKYSRMPISEDPSIYGAGYENWFRLEFQRPAFCIELTPYNNTDIPHDDGKFDNLVWNNARFIGLFLAEEALKR